MFEVAGGGRFREHVAQRRTYSDRSNAAHSTSLPAFARLRRGKHGKLIGGYRTGINASCHRIAIGDSRMATFRQQTPLGALGRGLRPQREQYRGSDSQATPLARSVFSTFEAPPTRDQNATQFRSLYRDDCDIFPCFRLLPNLQRRRV